MIIVYLFSKVMKTMVSIGAARVGAVYAFIGGSTGTVCRDDGEVRVAGIGTVHEVQLQEQVWVQEVRLQEQVRAHKARFCE